MQGRVSRGGGRALKRMPLPALFCAGVKGLGISEPGQVQPVHWPRIEALPGGARGAHGETTPRLYPDAFRLAVTGHVVPSNPAHAVRGPRYSVSKGSTPMLSSEEATALLKGYGRVNGRGPPPQGHRCRDDVHLRLRRRGRRAERRGLLCAEKAVVAAPPRENGKLNEMPFHHKLEDYLDAYIEAAGLRGDSQGAAVPLRDREDRRPYGRSMSRTAV